MTEDPAGYALSFRPPRQRCGVGHETDVFSLASYDRGSEAFRVQVCPVCIFAHIRQLFPAETIE